MSKTWNEQTKYGGRPDTKASTVRELIEKLRAMPQDMPVYVRPKYHGSLDWYEDAPVHVNGVAEMHPKGEPKNVTLLV